MSSLVDKKLWGSLSLDGISKAIKTAPKSYKVSEKYGKQLTFQAKQWDDGGISLSVSYQDAGGEWQRIPIGNVRISQDQGGAAPAAPAASQGFDDGAPF